LGASHRAVRHGDRSRYDRHGEGSPAQRDMVDRKIALHLHNYKTSGAELIMGSGRLVAPKTFEVDLNDGGTRVLAGDQAFLNVGTHAAIPSVPGLEAARPLTHMRLWSSTTCRHI